MRVERVVLMAAAGLAMVACHPRRLHHGDVISLDHRPMRQVDRLTCPDQVEGLKRTAQAGDGRSCAYAGPRSEEVELSLMPLDGATPDARLASLDTTLKAEVPGAKAGADHGPGVHVSSDADGDQAHIDLPGFHLNASGGKADIRMPGVSINADGDKAKVSTGVDGREQAVVDAHAGGAEIRAGGVGANGADVTYLLASDTPGPSGYRMVGYIAKGPASGPLVVGVFRSRDHQGHDGDDHGLDRLIDMNVHS